MIAAVTVDSLIEQAMQGGLWGVALGMVVWGIRSLWLFFKPHINDNLKARLKRYEAATKLTEGLQQTQFNIVEQHRQMLELLKYIQHDSRNNRKYVQRIAALMADHLCMATTDVHARIFDSDEGLENSDSSSDDGNTRLKANTR